MYGTIREGAFLPAPKTLTVDGMVHYHPSDEMYAEAGYLLRVDADRPKGDYTPQYEAVDGQAVQSWVASEPVAAPEITLETRVDTLETDVDSIINGLEALAL